VFRDGSGGPVKGETGLSALSFRMVTSFVVAQTLCLNMSAHIVNVYGLHFRYCSDCHAPCI